MATQSGIRVGDPEEKVHETYGDRVETETHEYDPEGSYLTFVPEDPSDNHRLVFETDGSQVTMMRAGQLPEVEYVEGCS